MPKSIQVYDVPDDVRAVLERRATDAAMSLSAYLRAELVELTTAAEPTEAAGELTNQEVWARVQTRTGGASHEAIASVIREMRGPTPPQ